MTRFQTMPRLSDEDYRLLEASILADGIVSPVIVDEDGEIIDGHHRHEIGEKHGLYVPVELREGLSEPEKVALSISLNVARRHLSREERRQIIEASLKAQPEKSNREHARTLGVDHKTVQAVREQGETTGEIPQLSKTVGADGRERTTQPASRPASLTPSPTVVEVDGVKVAETRHIPVPPSPRPVMDADAANLDNARTACDALMRYLSTMRYYSTPEVRERLLNDYWPLASRNGLIFDADLFTSATLRRVADGLTSLATEMEQHNDYE